MVSLDDAGGDRALDTASSQSELSREAPAPNGGVSASEEDAFLQSAPALSPESAARENPSAAGPELPVASIQPPVALLLPGLTDPALLENRLERLEAELAQLRQTAAATTRIAQQPARTQAARPARGLPSMVPNSIRHTWLLFEALAELRAMYWMFLDPRYRLSWTARLVPLVILVLIMTSYYWTPGTMILPLFLGTVFEKLCDLVLAFGLFKLLSYEARRYRETAPDLPPSLRL